MSGEQAGSVLAALGLVPLLTMRDPRLRALGFAAWSVGVLIVAGDLLSSPIATLRVEATRRPALATAGIVAGLIGLAVAAWLLDRWPWLLLVAAVAAAPARVPFHAGGQEANLLVPMYGVIAAAAVVAGWRMLRGAPDPVRLGWVGWAAAALILFSALSMLWTVDRHEGAVEMLFFYLPFGFLLARLGGLTPGTRDLKLALGVQVALALLFAGVAFFQEATHHLFWNPKVIVANEYAAFFRVNSLFWDASIYGRFLALTLVLLAGVCAFKRMAWQVLAVMAVLFVGLYFAYSQSSLLALAAGCLVLGTGIWSRRVTIGLVAAALVVGLAGLALALHGNSTNSVSSDRSTLLSDGARIVRHHPVAGAGIGGFARAALAGSKHPNRVAGAASHTTPMTVIAEVGPIGLLLYIALLAAVVTAALRGPGPPAVRLTLASAFAALFAASLFYNAFFEDPACWILMALIATLPAQTVPLREAPA